MFRKLYNKPIFAKKAVVANVEIKFGIVLEFLYLFIHLSINTTV